MLTSMIRSINQSDNIFQCLLLTIKVCVREKIATVIIGSKLNADSKEVITSTGDTEDAVEYHFRRSLEKLNNASLKKRSISTLTDIENEQWYPEEGHKSKISRTNDYFEDDFKLQPTDVHKITPEKFGNETQFYDKHKSFIIPDHSSSMMFFAVNRSTTKFYDSIEIPTSISPCSDFVCSSINQNQLNVPGTSVLPFNDYFYNCERL
ncbi:hypothetical protein GJ496_010118 [Pomphorhynchus laevis]|nr:hypothetical protein GJ496_010118 [Pomphorhynchus laevis]